MKRIYGLDVFRSFAILLVLLLHGTYLLEPALGNFPYVRLPDGVELFFVLSGFLIGGILIRTYEDQNKFDFKSLFRFWKRRWIRTLPNYYLVLLLNILVVYLAWNGSQAEHISWKFFFFLQNFNDSFHSFFWESWSLSIEEWFYISLPFVLLLLSYSLKKICSKKYILLITTLILIIAPITYRAIISDDQHIDFFHFDVSYRKMVIMRLDSIVYGVLFAWIAFYYTSFWKAIRYPAFLLGLGYIYAVATLPVDINQYAVKVFYYPITSLCCALFLPLASSIVEYKTFFGKCMTHISKISYSMYLLHLGLISSVIQFQIKTFTPLSGLLWFAFYICFTIILSTLLYKYFEKPIMDKR